MTQSLARRPLRLRNVLRIGPSPERLRLAADQMPATLPGRAPARLGPALHGLLVASVAIPLLLLAVAAWQNYRLVRAGAGMRVTNTAAEMREQALKVFETYALVLDWVDDRAGAIGWDRIAHDRNFHRFLSDLAGLPQIDGVRVADTAGRVRASGRFFPVQPVDVSDSDYFKAQQRARSIPYVGHDHIGKLTHLPEFDISLRLSTPDGSFGGIVTISARPSYFSDFYSTISHQSGFVALLIHKDGSVLARYPAVAKMPTLSPDNPLMRALAGNPGGGMFRGKGIDGIARLYGYQRVRGYPVYVLFGIPTADVLAIWGANLINYSLFAVPASLGLFLLTLFALRRLQWHALLRWRWRITAQRLRREIRQREMAEDELRQAHKMEALGQLTGSVAHDFNNLLAILQISLETLRGRQRDGRLEAKVDLALETIARGEKLIGQLLAFARCQPLQIESVDVNARIHGMAELLARTLGGKIAIETDLAPDLTPAHVDANQLELAVLNLVINARDAMPEGGVLRIHTSNDVRRLALPEALAKSGGDFVALEISDTGCGMPPDVLVRVFEPFFTTKEPGKGTGLGLSAVYGFARQSGGTAMIKSAVGHGTTVILVLPQDRMEAAGTGAEVLPAAGPA